MKPKSILRPFLAAIGCATIAISSASAQTDGTWNQAATGAHVWGDAANWLDGIVADGTDATASFTVNASGAQTLSLATDVTIGNLALNRNQNLTINTGIEDPKTLTFDVGTGKPLISTTPARMIRIESVVAGSDGLEVTGGGTGGGVALAGANTFTGGIHLNGGSLGINNNTTTTAGLNGNLITVTGTSWGAFVGGTDITGGVHINDAANFRAGTNNSTLNITGALTGSGTLTHQQYGLGNQAITITDGSAFTGNIDYDMPRSATTRVNSLGDSGKIRLGISNFLSNQDRQHVFEFGSGATADLVFNNRQIEILGSAPNPGPRPNAAFEIRSNNANHALIINPDLLTSHTGTETNLRFSGSSTQANTFAGQITDGPGVGESPSVLSIFKLNAGTWIFAGNNTYTGTTTISAGRLVINGNQSAATGAVAVDGTSTLGGSGTLGGSVTVAAGANLAPGATVGTLSIGGDLNISAMAGGNGRLFYDVGSIAASDRIAVGGTLDIGEGLLGFSDFNFSNVGGLQAGTYTLITSSALTGTLNGADLVGSIGTFNATLKRSGNKIELSVAAPPPSATLVIDLGAGTQIPGGAFGTFGALNLPIPPLPAGSILRAVEVNAVLQATNNGNFASDLAVLFDPTPATPGGDFSVVITNGAIKFGAPVQIAWPAAANAGPPAPLVDTKVAAAWAAAGTIDLATTGIFLGNSFNSNPSAPNEGGTWSGTITLTYDIEATGTPYELWAGPGVTFDGDASGDGVSNGLAFLLGAASPNDNALGLLPDASEVGGGLVLTFSMLDAAARGTASLAIEHSSSLAADSWTTVAVPATSGTVDDVVFTITGSGPLEVSAAIPASKAANGKLFGRLKATE